MSNDLVPKRVIVNKRDGSQYMTTVYVKPEDALNTESVRSISMPILAGRAA